MQSVAPCGRCRPRAAPSRAVAAAAAGRPAGRPAAPPAPPLVAATPLPALRELHWGGTSVCPWEQARPVPKAGRGVAHWGGRNVHTPVGWQGTAKGAACSHLSGGGGLAARRGAVGPAPTRCRLDGVVASVPPWLVSGELSNPSSTTYRLGSSTLTVVTLTGALDELPAVRGLGRPLPADITPPAADARRAALAAARVPGGGQSRPARRHRLRDHHPWRVTAQAGSVRRGHLGRSSLSSGDNEAGEADGPGARLPYGNRTAIKPRSLSCSERCWAGGETAI